MINIFCWEGCFQDRDVFTVINIIEFFVEKKLFLGIKRSLATQGCPAGIAVQHSDGTQHICEGGFLVKVALLVSGSHYSVSERERERE